MKSNGVLTYKSKINHDFKPLDSDLPSHVNDQYYRYEKGGGLKEATYLYGLYIINGHWRMMEPLRMLGILEGMKDYWINREPKKAARIQKIQKTLIQRLKKD